MRHSDEEIITFILIVGQQARVCLGNVVHLNQVGHGSAGSFYMVSAVLYSYVLVVFLAG